MNSKDEIVENWLPRYTGLSIEEVNDYVLLTNFQYYLERISAHHPSHIARF